MPEPHARREDLPRTSLPVWIGAISAAALAAAFLLLPYRTLITRVILDDAFYYVRVALNVTAGQGITYDGVTYTNGFHPLWGVLLLLPALSGSDVFTLYAALALSAGFVALGVWSLVVLARELSWGPTAALIAVAVFVFPRVDLYMSLMESGPSAALLLVGLALGTRYRWLTTESYPQAVAFGLWLATIFLVRLDFAFIVGTAALAAVFLRFRSGRPIRAWLPPLTVAGLAAALPAAAYLIANRITFAHFVPVSGRKKHVFLLDLDDPVGTVLGGVGRMGEKLGLSLTPTLGLVLAGLILVIVVTVWLRRRVVAELGDRAPRLLAGGMLPVLIVGMVARAIYMRLFVALEANTVPWYWVPEYVTIACLAGYAAAVMLARLRIAYSPLPRVAPWILLAVAWPLGITFVVRDNGFFVQTPPSMVLDAADWAREQERFTRCGFYDSGLFSWASGIPCVSLNGLISDEETMLASKDERFDWIMDEHGVDVYVEYCTDDQIERAPPGGVIWHSEHAERLRRLDGHSVRLCLFDRSVYDPYRDPHWKRP